MRAAKVQASLRIRAVSPEPPLLAHTGSESRGTFRQKARSLAPLDGWACAVKICHDGMLEDTNSLGGAQFLLNWRKRSYEFYCIITANDCHKMSPVKRICVFEHSVMTNFNCACLDIQRGQGSGFLSDGSSWFTACMSEQRRFWRDCADAQARLNLRCSLMGHRFRGARATCICHPSFCFKTWQICITDFFANWKIISILSDKSALMRGVCMNVTSSFQFYKVCKFFY